MTAQTKNVSARKRGNALGFWFFRSFLRVFGLRGAYGLLYPVCTYYLLFDRTAVRAAQAYIRRRFRGHGPLRQHWDVYRLFVSQGRNLIDRYYLLGGGPGIEIRLEDGDRLDAVLQGQQGFVLLLAHLGNWQAIMTVLRRFQRQVYLVMRPEDNPAVAGTLRIGADAERVSVISPEGPLGNVVAIMDAIEHGGVVAIMGDRSYAFRSVPVDFLGDRARFSCGAFHIAAAAGCPLVVLLAAKTARRTYVVRVEDVFHPRYQAGAGKREQLRGWVQQFAKRMERYVAQYPFQCFLFHDVWREAEEQDAPTEPHRGLQGTGTSGQPAYGSE